MQQCQLSFGCVSSHTQDQTSNQNNIGKEAANFSDGAQAETEKFSLKITFSPSGVLFIEVKAKQNNNNNNLIGYNHFTFVSAYV